MAGSFYVFRNGKLRFTAEIRADDNMALIVLYLEWRMAANCRRATALYSPTGLRVPHDYRAVRRSARASTARDTALIS